MVVRAGRRLDSADQTHGRSARHVQPGAGVPAHAGPRRTDSRLQRVHPDVGPPLPGPEDLDAPALLRPGGFAPADQTSPRDGRPAPVMGREPPGFRADGACAVLTGLLPISAGRTGRTRG